MTDRQTFERVAVPHLDAAFALAFSLLRSRADAEDAVQDAYLRAYGAFHQVSGSDIKPWLLAIVRNVCYRRLEHRRRDRNVISLDEMIGARTASAAPGDVLRAEGASPEGLSIRASERALLARAMGALPPAFREVIVLREIEGLSYREIAEVIEAPIGTVMSRLSRARADLRTMLIEMTGEDDSNAV